jgi:pyridoxal phosphate enzyme (YggS family)
MAAEMNSHIEAQLLEVKEKIAEAALKANREPDEVKLIAVSKTFPAEAVVSAYEAGQRAFGENRVLELADKKAVLPDDIEWHMIGHLQSNKALKAVENAAWIHSVDSVKLLERLERLDSEQGCRPKILLEINVSGEASKFGTDDFSMAMNLAHEAFSCENLDFKGLMTMAPFGAEENELREVFAGLRELRDRMETELGTKLPELSMGMSQDFEQAIAEGATMVRIGTAIFGKRDYKL